MRIAFFEDGCAADLRPLVLLRPVFELVCGHYSLRERLLRSGRVADWGAFVREPLAEVYREEFPEARVNDQQWLAEGTTLLVNGRWLPPADALDGIDSGEAGVLDDALAYVTIDPSEAPLLSDHNWETLLARLAKSRRIVRAAGRLMRHPWDLVQFNAGQLADDFHARRAGERAGLARMDHAGRHAAVLGPAREVYVDAAATIDPYVVLDARRGPIWIEAGAHVGSFTQLEGPCFVGSGSRLYRAHVRQGTTIGPECRAGGEIEGSILHGYVNKYHLGFLGHSYVCPWVNLGALVTNSDLKNDYSAVSVPLWGEAIDTGQTKVGCFLADHAKVAIGGLFNTGSSVGVMAQVLPGGELTPKHVPSFARVWHGALDDGTELTRLLATARVAMGRRNRELTPAQERLLRHLHAETEPERRGALERDAEKRAREAEQPR